MSNLVWRVLLTMVLAGHFGGMLAGYNRINGFGIPRKTIKRIVKGMFAFTMLLPPAVAWFYGKAILDLWHSPNTVSTAAESPLRDFPLWLLFYAAWCLATWPLLGIPWLIFRPIFGLEWVKVKRHSEIIDVRKVTKNRLPLSLKCRLESQLPMNQLFELSIDQIELPVVGLPAKLDGYRIAHLSDVHLTGDVHPDFSSYIVGRANAWQPDLMALSGDIIDKQSCIDWLGQIFGQASAPDGCYFVLGNHDTRVVDSWQTRDAMDRAGWTDLGSRGLPVRLRDVPSLVIGNEHPWFRRPVISQRGSTEQQRTSSSTEDQAYQDVQRDEFRLLISHSPDQLGWARRHHVHLMLAGHTHGGQGRLPLAGPLLSPSFHGSRYASGDFFKRPTTMHVTRGLCGTHLVRFRCRPELSLLTLRAS